MANLERTFKEDPLSGPFLFVVNPNSGTGNVRIFHEVMGSKTFDRPHDIVISKNQAHSIELTQTAAANGYKAVIAVGGDGSVHEIGAELIDSETALGIIPTGSGNGVSRHLGISNDIEQSVKEIMQGHWRRIDTFTVNAVPVIGFCGFGIDAHVAQLFDEANERGFSNYVKLTIDVFTNYQPQAYTLNLGSGETSIHHAYTLVVANTSQFGNNAYINPTGSDDDGLLDIVVVKDFPPTALMPLASRLFLKSLNKSKHIQHFTDSSLNIVADTAIPFQIDGEPMPPSTTLSFELKPLSLRVIIP